MSARDRLVAALSDIDTQIARIQDDSRARIRALQAKKEALIKVGKLLTPEVEEAITLLKSLGIDL